MYQAFKAKQNKQSPPTKTPKKVRFFTHSYNNIPILTLLTLLQHHASSSSPCTQIEIEQITIRFKESYKSLSQVSPSSTPQRKLLRLKDSPNKRTRMEQLHTKSKTRKRPNK